MIKVKWQKVKVDKSQNGKKSKQVEIEVAKSKKLSKAEM